MQNLKFKSVCCVVALVCLVSLDVAWGEGQSKRGFFDSFANFFTPSGSIQGEGPVFDELKGVESQIDKVEVQYSRERRPGNKTRYRKQLDSLRNVRDSLITVIEKMSSGSVAVASSNSAKSATSSASLAKVPVIATVTTSSATSSAAQVNVTTAVAVPTSSASVSASSVAAIPSTPANVVCVHDTVLVHDTLVVRDTVVIHDTLYVVLANKPKAAAPKEKKKADNASAK